MRGFEKAVVVRDLFSLFVTGPIESEEKRILNQSKCSIPQINDPNHIIRTRSRRKLSNLGNRIQRKRKKQR